MQREGIICMRTVVWRNRGKKIKLEQKMPKVNDTVKIPFN